MRHDYSISPPEVSQPSCQKAELTSLLTQQSRKKYTHLSLHFLALSLHSTSSSSPLPLLCDEWKVWILLGLPGSHIEALSSWTNKTLSNLKVQSGIYLNHVHFGYICVWPWSDRKGTWKINFSWDVITQNLDFFPYKKIQTLNKYLQAHTMLLHAHLSNPGNEFNEENTTHTQINHYINKPLMVCLSSVFKTCGHRLREESVVMRGSRRSVSSGEVVLVSKCEPTAVAYLSMQQYQRLWWRFGWGSEADHETRRNSLCDRGGGWKRRWMRMMRSRWRA